MTPERRTLAVSLAIVLLVAACGGSAATATPQASSATGATTAPGATDAAATPAAATEAPAPTDNEATSAPDVSLAPGSAGELEGMLPSSVNGVEFTKTSFSGSSLPITLPIDSGTFGTFLTDNGKSVADFAYALATPTDPAKSSTVMLMAWQVKGVDGTKLAAFLGADSGLTAATVGGKKVQQTSAGGMGLTLYVKGDVVFYILAFGDASLTEGIVSALP